MAINFSDVNLLEQAKVKEKERWLYIADANDPKLKRIEEEIEDIAQISNAGGIVLVLAHEGRYGRANKLDYVAKFLQDRTQKKVLYFPNSDETAVDFAKSREPGAIAVLGNTRMYEGEESKDAEKRRKLAEVFSRLGDKVAMGGFGKAHRKNASNYELLDFLPGYLTRSQFREMQKLERWAGKSEKYSVAVLGGVKGEKIKDGLAGFVNTYDFIIPGGIVLNTIYKVLGYKIGDSKIDDDGKTFEQETWEIIKRKLGKIYIPMNAVVAKNTGKGFEDRRVVNMHEGVRDVHMIVDFVIDPEEGGRRLNLAVEDQGRIVMAGTPGIYTAGFREATDFLIPYMNRNSENSIALGGDTAQEIKKYGVEFNAQSSTGGGSALYLLAHGTTQVFEKLRENKTKFQ